MNKILRVTLVLALIITPLASATMIRSDYQVTVGQTYTFDIINAKIYLDIDGSTTSGNGYVLGGQHHSHGTQCEVEVTGVVPATYVNWTITAGTAIDYGLSSILDLDALGFLFVYCLPLYEAVGEMSLNDALNFVGYGTGLILLPFWDTFYLSSDFNILSDDLFISTFKGLGPYEETTILADHKQISGNDILEWFMGGSIVADEPGLIFDMQFNHQLRTVYSSSTGVLQGIKMTSHVIGMSNNKEIELKIDYLAELVGYDIDDYTFAPVEFTPGFEWFIAISALSLITIPIIIYRKRKS